jgi:peptidoglycan/xylan/chitin deacetylase (PgdA/CDA1 family)
MLSENKATATFFVTGKVLKQEPEIIKSIARGGHEIAIHSLDHCPLNCKKPEKFDEEIKIMKEMISALTGKKVRGHRAVNFSLTKENIPWVTEVLINNQLQYDSSIFPFRLPRLASLLFPKSTYGLAQAPLFPYLISRDLNEFPLAVYRKSFINWPVTGGIYIRLTPWWIFKKLLAKRTLEGITVIHFHPFDFSLHAPRIKMPFIKKNIKFINTKACWNKLNYLLATYSCQSIEKYLYESTSD